MAVPVQGQVAPQVVGDGTPGIIRLDRSSAVVVSEAHGRYYESAFRRAIFSGGNATGVTTSVAFATTYTGLCLSNPIGSSVNLVMNKVNVDFAVAAAAVCVVGIMTGFNNGTQVVHTTPIAPLSNFIGGTGGQGLLDSACTLPTAPTLRTILNFQTATAVTAVNEPTTNMDLEGSIILPPGAYAAIYTS